MRRARAQGFTLIEVMVALGVLTIGAMAIIALLVHIMRSNAHARQLNTGMNVSQQWVDRIKQDAHTWTQIAAVAGTPTVADVLTSTLYLRNVTSPPSTTFRTIPATSATVSAAFDFQGRDVALLSGGQPYHFCTAYRANWIYFGSAMRVDIRVFWPRSELGVNIMTDWPLCNGDHSRLDPPNGALLGRYHVMYLPTAVGVTPVPR
jgi:prepilin-type N-terminal cleavage/methylation domain-containing protein